jgi:hypothetical protein
MMDGWQRVDRQPLATGTRLVVQIMYGKLQLPFSTRETAQHVTRLSECPAHSRLYHCNQPAKDDFGHDDNGRFRTL